MLRRLFTLLSALSLLLCVATVVLWVRSYWVSDVAIGALGGGQHSNIRSSVGEVWFACIVLDDDARPIVSADWELFTERPPPRLAGSGLVEPSFWARRGLAVAFRRDRL